MPVGFLAIDKVLVGIVKHEPAVVGQAQLLNTLGKGSRQ
jgi:hypothetical protein